ncbi:MAG TPA: TetR/AcrR family transcriptional regulator [Woeseiaceae bacterium]|nr:TetR/AcrR family transcriptional regulator [Woeseiaceae bacterium]
MVQKTGKRARGRPRAYDPDQALARAMDTFWIGGYSGTSLDALSASTGMQRPSLYGAFGDKRSLYLEALERYTDESIASMRETLDFESSLRDGLATLYHSAISFYAPRNADPRGCFLIGTAAVEAMSDPGIRNRLRKALRRLDRVFEDRFRQAQATGELDRQADPAALAKMASAVLHTLALRSRAGDSRPSLRAIAEHGVQMICGARSRR